jgi:exoribonuclease-2
MAFQGTIIEYLDNGKFICAFVVAESDRRLNILTQNGRDATLPVARVVHRSEWRAAPGTGREEILNRLLEVARRRQLLIGSVDLEEIWQVIGPESETIFDPRFLAELQFGHETTDDHTAAFLRAVFQDRLYFKYKDGGVICHAPAMVDQLRQRQERERRHEEFLVRGVAGINRIWEDGGDDWPERDTSLAMIQDYYLFGNEAPQSEIARQLLKRAGLAGPNDAFHLLVKAGIWDRNENIPLLRHGIAVHFGPAAVEQAATCSEPDIAALLAEGRQDLRNLSLLTIDGKETRDFDDALHIIRQGENFQVGVHITDASRIIKPGSPLFAEALARGTSIYFPEGPLPMLPHSISEGILSLIAGRPRAAMSIIVLLSPTGTVLDFSVIPSVVVVKRQLNYTEVDRLIGDDEELTALSRLSCILRERRLNDGALILPFPDVNIRIDPADPDHIEVVLTDSDTPSRVLVSEFMILANTLAAQFLAERETPGLFRSQPAPRRRLAAGYCKDLFLNIQQRKLLSPMTLSSKPNPHHSLGVAQYTTITSPIRRLLDLIMQHQLLALVTRNGALFSKKELKTFAATITNLTTRANGVKQLRHRYWIFKLLESHQGKQVRGLIIDKGPRRVHVLLRDFMLDSDLPASQAGGEAPGETVPVRIAKVDALNNLLRIER